MAYTYKHVVIVGLDGMGNFNKNTSTPFMDKIFENGAKSFYSLSLYPTISAQNWGAMLIGTDPDVHGLTNSIVGREPYRNKELPTVFSTLRSEMPNAVLCSISDWNPINIGIVEDGIDVYKDTAPDGTKTTDKVVECVLNKKPNLLFIQIDDPDGAGHGYGYGTKGHLDCIKETDKLVNRIFEAYTEAGIIDDTLFITITDHGGYVKGHGGYSEGEKYIYFALRGKTVKKCDEFFAQTKDINAIVRHAFGIEIPEYDSLGYSSQVPEGIFEDYEKPYKKPEAKRFDVQNRPTPQIDGKDGLYSYFDKDKIKLAMFFDNNFADATGKYEFIQKGKVKYYSTGVSGAMGEFGATGCLVCDKLKFGSDSFTVACWLKIDDAPSPDCMICSTKTMAASGAGFSLGFTNAGTLMGIETEDKDSYFDVVTPFVREVSGGWLHSVYCFDKNTLGVDVYHNFKYKTTIKLPEIFNTAVDCLPFTVGDDASCGENMKNGLIFNMDDLFIFNKAFNRSDVEKLKEYYNL